MSKDEIINMKNFDLIEKVDHYKNIKNLIFSHLCMKDK